MDDFDESFRFDVLVDEFGEGTCEFKDGERDGFDHDEIAIYDKYDRE